MNRIFYDADDLPTIDELNAESERLGAKQDYEDVHGGYDEYPEDFDDDY